MATLVTYDAKGNKEDLSDIITMIAVEQTPIFSLFGKAKATGVYHTWVEDTLRDPKDNALVEGGNYSVEAPGTGSLKGNYTQIFAQPYGVSKTQEAVAKAGVKSSIARAMTKAMKEVARDVEYAYINNTAAVAGDASTARKLAGLQGQITSNVLDNGGTARDLTETLLNDAIQAGWDEGGSPDTVIVCGKHKRQISGFTASNTRNIEAGSKKLVAAVDVYESDFGIVRIVADQFMVTNKLFVIDKDYWKTAYLRPFAQDDLKPSGSRIEKVIEGELTLEGRAEKACAILADLN